ncbi:MAG: M20/M25/M40 family metallo-hydrolase [Candidatus Levybacteria bacterium]|nr:M20/M25/M40 family metallo-hydrolase [Candidatus Levybacteria bacterium]
MNRELLQTLVETASVYPEEQAISGVIKGILTGYGLDVKEVPTDSDRNNLVGTFGQSDMYIGFYGHMDTVPAHPGWQQNPFELRIKGDKATGLGVQDMKGGLVAILRVAEFAAKNDLPVKVFFGVDEENISKGAHDLVDSGEMNDVAFLVVGESGQVDNYEQPYAVNYGRKGHVQFDIDVHGKAAHAAESHKGVNAIEEASRLIVGMQGVRLGDHERLGTSNIVLRAIHADTTSLSVPDSCRLRVSLLSTPGVKSSDFVAKMHEVSEETGVSADVVLVPRETPYNEAFEIDRENPFLKLIEAKLILLHGVEVIYSGSVADENVFANRLGIPILSLGPIGGGEHTEQEWLSLQSLDETIRAYQEICALYSGFNNQASQREE